MPDRRQHRGPHPQDHELFSADQLPRLQQACEDLRWLFDRGYVLPSAMKLVGDRYELNSRQRLAVCRSTCSQNARERREEHEAEREILGDAELWLDGFNLLTSIETALSGGVILHGQDGCYRDMASMHGNYRKVEETLPALKLIGETLAILQTRRSLWLLDQPVSNSGRLKTIIQSTAEENGWDWRVRLVPNPDPLLIETEQIVATADSGILDQVQCWFNLARYVIESHLPTAWVIRLDQ